MNANEALEKKGRLEVVRRWFGGGSEGAQRALGGSSEVARRWLGGGSEVAWRRRGGGSEVVEAQLRRLASSFYGFWAKLVQKNTTTTKQ